MTLKKKALENTVGKGKNAGNQHFLALLALRQRAYVMVCCLSYVSPTVR